MTMPLVIVLQQKALPPKEKFYSSLTLEHITDEEYQNAQTVFTTFNMSSLSDYHNLYLKSDILQLSDVMEQFRKFTLKNLKLDPCFYLSTPGLTYDAALFMTGVELELITDAEMYSMWESCT